MKIQRLILSALFCAVATVMSACSGDSSNPTPPPPAPSAPAAPSAPNPAIVSAEKNSFHEVAAHLDTGGDFYAYLGTERWLSGLSENVSAWRQLVAGIPDFQKDTAEINQVFDLLATLTRQSGIEDISGVGLSSIAVEKDFYRSRAILHHYKGQRTGYIWSVFGKSPHPLPVLDMLPTNTAFAVCGDFDAALAWKTIHQHVTESGFHEARAAMNQLPNLFQQMTSMRWDDTLASLGGEYAFVLTLNEERMIRVPAGGGEMIEIPEPGLMFVFKVKDDSLFKYLEEKMKVGPEVIRKDVGGLRMRTVPVPLPFPIAVRPTLAQGGDYLFISLNEKLVEDAMAIKSGTIPGFKSTDEYKRLARDLPAEGNGFGLATEKLGRTLTRLREAAIASKSDLSPGDRAMLSRIFGANSFNQTLVVAANTDEGWKFSANGTGLGTSAAIGTMAAPAGLLAAIAIPNFVKARTTAQLNTIKANLRMLEAAKAQWALENNKSRGTIVLMSDLNPFFSKRPTPIVNEEYRINPIGTAPEAIVPEKLGDLPPGSVIRAD